MAETWAAGEGYEPYIGRWSREVARRFVPWLAADANQRWLDVGCGTGALTAAVLEHGDPADVVGIDPSDGFLDYAQEHVRGATFRRGDAMAIPADDDEFDAAVS